jgi:hypothetical protein
LRKDYRELLRPFRRRSHTFHETRLLGDIAHVPPIAIAPRSAHIRGPSRKELGKGLVNKILKDLGLK